MRKRRKVMIWIAIVFVAVIVTGWTGIRVKPASFEGFSQAQPELHYAGLPAMIFPLQ